MRLVFSQMSIRMAGHSESPAGSVLCKSSSEDFHSGSTVGGGFRPSAGSGDWKMQREIDFMPYMHVPKRSPRQEYRLKQREWIEASPLITEKFPRLKALKVTLEFFDAAGSTKQGEMKCKLN